MNLVLYFFVQTLGFECSRWLYAILTFLGIAFALFYSRMWVDGKWIWENKFFISTRSIIIALVLLRVVLSFLIGPSVLLFIWSALVITIVLTVCGLISDFDFLSLGGKGNFLILIPLVMNIIGVILFSLKIKILVIS